MSAGKWSSSTLNRLRLLALILLGVAVLAVLAVLAFLAGCSGVGEGGGEDDSAEKSTPRIVQPGAPGEPSRTISPEEAEELEAPGYTAADVSFMQGMIQHHAQALYMTGLVPSRTTSRDVGLLARRMDLSQESEVEVMQRWLQERDEEAPAVHRVHGHAHGPLVGERMPGMASEEELDELASARGAEFEHLFLELMIRHHEGALTMVRDLRDAGGSLESEIDAFARHVEADQQIEIERMRGLREKLGAQAR